jgi:hypothetical protein
MARRTHLQLNGKVWTLIEGGKHRTLDGRYHTGKRQIRVYAGQRPKARRESIIHEVIHAVYPGLPERMVIQLGADITDALCKLNLNFKEEWLRADEK